MSGSQVFGSLARLLKSSQRPRYVARNSRVLLSIVVPAFNVEKYLEKCLISLKCQELGEFEVIVIDDGSTDGTLNLAKKLSKSDSRIRVYSQNNAGLGAVRNRGIKLAKGKYLTFVDSDDFVPVDAYRKLVDSLERTGSDIAIGQLYRQSGNKLVYPRWSRELHAKDLLGIKVEDFPEILRDFYSPNKVFRTEFWKRQDLWFREGVLFEDQPVISQLLLQAQSVDVLSTLSYCWIVRDDNSSLSSDMYEPWKVQARVEAARLTRQYLDQFGNAQVLRAWQRIQTTMYLPSYIRNSVRYDGDAAEAVQELCKECLTLDELDTLVGIQASDRVLVSAALSLTAPELRHFVSHEYQALSRTERQVAGGALHFKSQTGQERLDQILEQPIPVSTLPVETGILDVRSEVDGLVVTGYTLRKYIAGSRKVEPPVIRLTSPSGEFVVGVVNSAPNDLVNRFHRDGFEDYSGTAWSCHFENASLNAAKRGTWILEVQGESAGDGALPRLFSSGPGTLEPLRVVHPVGERSVVLPQWVSGGQLQLEILDRSCVLVRVTSRRNGLEILVDAPKRESRLAYLVIRKGQSESVIPLNVSQVQGRSRGSALVPYSTEGALAVRYSDGSKLDVFHSRGVRLPLERGIITVGRRAGVHLKRDAFIVRELRKDRLDLIVELTDPLPKNALLVLVQGKSSIVGRRLSESQFAFDSRLLADDLPNKFSVYAQLQGNAGSKRLSGALKYGHDVSVREDLAFDEFVIRPISSASGATVEVRPLPYASESAEVYAREFSRQGITLRSNLVYLQCLRGGSAADSQLALRRSLARISPETKVVWGVASANSWTPAGDSRVVLGTAEWVEALLTAPLVCVNHELPNWFVRSEGQTVLQTYHGHPFKMMGISRWASQQRCPEDVSRNLARRENWTHLLSPSHRASQLYKREFPLEYELLEFGAPRNDELTGDLSALASNTRKALNLDSDKRFILYAPTWRDYSAASPWASGIPRFIEWDSLLAGLPEDVEVLFRGHHSQMHDAASTEFPARVHDVTAYPEINGLMALADVGIFDYSSVRFDFALVNKPMIAFVPDFDEYFSAGESLFPLSESVPGPIVKTQDELSAWLATTLASYAVVDNSSFNEEFSPWTDGRSADRLAEWVLTLPKLKESLVSATRDSV